MRRFLILLSALVICGCGSGSVVDSKPDCNGVECVSENPTPSREPDDVDDVEDGEPSGGEAEGAGEDNERAPAPDSYYDETAYSPAGHCTFHPRPDLHETQLWIGFPENSMIVNVTPVDFVVPDVTYAMALGYAQEFYDINPAFLIGISSKESFAFLNLAGTDTYLYNGDINGDGHFQIESPTFDDDALYFPSRLIQGDHDLYVGKFVSATATASLDFRFRHEYFTQCANFNFSGFLNGSRDPTAESEIVAYGYNRGIFSPEFKKVFITERERCINATDIVAECGLQGTWNYNTEVERACEAVAKASDIYDANIYWDDIEDFWEDLKITYPETDDEAWEAMISETLVAFDVLRGDNAFVSLRYDWLTILRVAKGHLPHHELPSGLEWGWRISGAPCR